MSGQYRTSNLSMGTHAPWRLLLALVCVLLVLVSGTVQVAHTHTDRVGHADCSMCSTAHAAAEVCAPAVGAVETLMVAHVVPDPQPVATNVVTTFALTVRPPPAA